MNKNKIEKSAISTIDKLIMLHEKKLELLKKHKKGLLQHFKKK